MSGIIESLTWQWLVHAALPDLWILSIPPQPIPAGALPTEPLTPAAPAPLIMVLFNENKAFSELGEFGGELGSVFTVAGKLPGADGVLWEGFEGFGAVLSPGVL